MAMIFEKSAEVERLLHQTFPRLHELYTASDRTDPANYFHHPNCLSAVKNCDDYLRAIEADLQQMDLKAWSDFKAKTARALTTQDAWGWNSQLFDRFDEAKGYRFLKEDGYSDIQFIPEQNGVRTPDLRGTRQDGRALLEVKTIRESDDENDQLTRRGEYQDKELEARQVEHFLNGAMRGKLQKTIASAAQQLAYPDNDVQRRILLLFIRLDLKSATQQTLDDLDHFLSSVQLQQLEIRHFIKNEFLL